MSTTNTTQPTSPAATGQVNFKINGQPVAVPKGTTVMQAVKKLAIEIPHFCWHPGLSVAGVCRFCMVKVEGRPKLEIACNLVATEGMDVKTNTEEVTEAHKWALEFHLINHPLDCPICDQAGECGLQDYYMSVGKYQSQMDRPKVLKPKALEVGGDLVLDTERCILCSRCVRFEEEVTKTEALGIFARGDRSIIGVFPGKKISHNYTTNLVDICPVGAFTSKDFRFKQRVWFLKDKPSVCPGCSTGCHVDVYANSNTRTYYRVKPRESEVNKFWMCDKGRASYKHLNVEERLRYPFAEKQGKKANIDFDEAVEVLAEKIKNASAEKTALLLSAQYTCEEYEAFLDYFVKKLGVKNVFQWREPTEKIEEFDGILWRGDQNSNTKGLLQALQKVGISAPTPQDQLLTLVKSRPETVIALVPEIPWTFPSLAQHMSSLAELPFVSFWSVGHHFDKIGDRHQGFPLRGFAEKVGTTLNHKGERSVYDQPFSCAIKDARDVRDIVAKLKLMMEGV